MNSIRSLWPAAKRALVVGVAVLSVFPALTRAEYASIAWSADGKSWGWARRQTQQLANKVALDGCNQDAPKRDCRVVLWKAFVYAEGTGSAGFGTSGVSVTEARAKAVSACGERAVDCKVTHEFTKPGFISVARTKNEDSNPHFFFSYGFDDSDSADSDAIAGCAKEANEECRVLWSGAIGGEMGNSPSSPVGAPTVGKEPASCRPTTPTVRCSSQCTNGNCIVTYENGCKLRVQVQPRFDGLTNQWTYPSPRC